MSTAADRLGNSHLIDATELASSLRQGRTAYGWQCLVTTVPVLLIDLLVCFACFCLVTLVMPHGADLWSMFAPFTASICIAMFAVGLHRVIGVHPIFEFRQLILSTMYSLLFLLSSGLLLGVPMPWVSIVLAHILIVLCLPVMRGMTRGVLSNHRWWGVRTIVLGADRRVKTLFSDHLANVSSGLRPIGFVEEKIDVNCSPQLRAWFLGTPAACGKLRKSNAVSCAIVHRHGREDHELVAFVQNHLQRFRRVYFYSDGMRLPTLWSGEGSVGIRYEDKLLRPLCRLLKRSIDLLVCLGVFLVGFPVFVGLVVWTRLSSPGPVFFGHERIGKQGHRFKVWKFRTMVTNAQEVLEEHLANNPAAQKEWDATFKLQNDPRITSAGRFLRKTSLDELPQLWNVIVGDMSLVGPRPIVAAEIERYAGTFKTYMRVRPGITGFWQVSGRNLTTYERRVELDEYYIRNWSIFFDLYVLGRTVKTVLFREGAF